MPVEAQSAQVFLLRAHASAGSTPKPALKSLHTRSSESQTPAAFQQRRSAAHGPSKWYAPAASPPIRAALRAPCCEPSEEQGTSPPPPCWPRSLPADKLKRAPKSPSPAMSTRLPQLPSGNVCAELPLGRLSRCRDHWNNAKLLPKLSNGA